MTHSKVWALIPAAGIGSRMQSKIPKQYLQIDGKTILEHTLSLFLQHPKIHKVVVALHPDDKWWDSLRVSENERVETVIGGDQRAISVLNGLHYINEQMAQHDWVMVHDAARPCLSVNNINDLLEAQNSSQDGAILAMPAIDTVKKINQQQSIEKTIPREQIWLAQTPQFFPVIELMQAIDTGIGQGLALTDEASAMEAQGLHPSLVIGSRKNIKITESEDLILASIWLSH